MRITIKCHVRAGDSILIGGYAVLVPAGEGMEELAYIYPSRELAVRRATTDFGQHGYRMVTVIGEADVTGGADDTVAATRPVG